MRTLAELQLGFFISLGRTLEQYEASGESLEFKLIRELAEASALPVRDHACSRYLIDDMQASGRFEVCQPEPDVEVIDGVVCGQLWLAVNADLRSALSAENVKTLVALVMGEAQKIQAADGGPEPKLAALKKYEVWDERNYEDLPLPV